MTKQVVISFQKGTLQTPRIIYLLSQKLGEKNSLAELDIKGSILEDTITIQTTNPQEIKKECKEMLEKLGDWEDVKSIEIKE